MNENNNNDLGVLDYYRQSGHEWYDLALADYINYPDASLTTFKNQNGDFATTINRYPVPAIRVNRDGLVVMRGLLRTSSGSNNAGGNVIAHIPKIFQPRHPQEIRFTAAGAILAYKPETGNLVVTDPYVTQNWLTINNVMYYID